MVNFDEYLVIDLETSIKNRGDEAIGTNKASPFCDKNDIVLLGVKLNNGIESIYTTSHLCDIPWNDYLNNVQVLVGHNIKFDLLYLYRDVRAIRSFIKNGGMVWDTQLAEYLITGQAETFPSLDSVTIKYGGTVKDERIKAFWEEGIDTEEIPHHMLADYLSGDLSNTELVYEEQQKRIWSRGIMNLAISQMEALLATTEMEYNGMYFDRGIAAEYLRDLIHTMKVLEDKTKAVIAEYIPAVVAQPNPFSNDQISLVLFGGSMAYKEKAVEYDEQGSVILYKSGIKAGKPKFKNVDSTMFTEGMMVNVRHTQELKKKGFYATNDKVLKHILTLKSNDHIKNFITMLLELRSLKKDISTYFIGYSDLCWGDGIIHGNLHHCSTATGRLSSSQPNLQNLTSTED